MAGGRTGRIVALQTAGVGLVVGGLLGLLTADLQLGVLISYWGDYSPLTVTLAVLAGVAWRLRWARLSVSLLTVALALVWLLVAFTPLASCMTRGLVRRDAPEPADAVFVLGSRLQADGDPTSGGQARLLRGVELVAQGFSQRLIVSEIEGHPPLHQESARGLLAGLGVTGQVLVVGPIRNTRDEAVAVSRLFEARGYRTLLLVTSPSHSRRAAAAFEAVGLTVRSVPCRETDYDIETLDHLDERFPAFSSALHERVGLLWYRLRGHASPRSAPQAAS